MSSRSPAAPRTETVRFAALLSTVVTSGAAVLVALAIGALFILISNDNPLLAYRALVQGAFGGKRAIAETLVAATPFILGGLAFAVAARAGMFNIGIEGQLMMGGLASGLLGAYDLGLPTFVFLPLCLLAAALAGGVWGAIAGVLKARTGAHEVISTIMLNYLAFRINTYVITGSGKRFPVDRDIKGTLKIQPEARLPILPGWGDTRLHAGIVVALLAAAALWYVLFRTTFGYRLRTVGQSRGAAAYAGIPWGRTIVIAMFVSGMLAGLMGAGEALGLQGRHYSNPPGYGFTAIAVGLVGRNHPLGMIFSGVLFGALRSGATNMQNQVGTSKELVQILQGLVILSISALAASQRLRGWRAKRRGARAAPPDEPATVGVEPGAPAAL